ncbi:MAG: hypothetical protein M0R39_15935, partial [Prolixibacteraceae bacterium]|nr:hypothetical protein [Prolixibacteraceae bacterium]
MISGNNKQLLSVLLFEHDELIARIIEILRKGRDLRTSLQQVCDAFTECLVKGNSACTRISFSNQAFVSQNFEETPLFVRSEFHLSDGQGGFIELFFSAQNRAELTAAILEEANRTLDKIVPLLVGLISKIQLERLQHENTERLKELKAINQTTLIIEEGKMVDETLQEICDILPKSWQYPKYTVARIRFEGKSYKSANFTTTEWGQSENFVTIDSKKGTIDIFYLKQFPKEDEGPFLREERNLLINIAMMISGYLNNSKGREIIDRKGTTIQPIHHSDDFRNSLTKSKKPLQLYFNQQSIDKYVYLDMMRLR